MSSEEEKIGLLLLEKEFEMSFPSTSLDKLKDVLSSEIIRLMLHDSEKLWNILYRIDVNEQKVKELFRKAEPKSIAPELSNLIINRMIQKAKTRIAYRNRDKSF